MRLIREGLAAGAFRIPPREEPWLDRPQNSIEALPSTETEFIDLMMPEVDTTKFVAGDYEIG